MHFKLRLRREKQRQWSPPEFANPTKG
jgi:hypothetical protein